MSRLGNRFSGLSCERASRILAMRLFALIVFVGFCGGIVYGYKQFTQGFRLGKCLINWPFAAEWEIPDPNPEIVSVLSKPFSYYAKGNQCFVFLSQDGNYVLKLFRADSFRLPFSEQKLRKWVGAKTRKDLFPHERTLKNLMSYHLAYSLAQKQTGVVFIHLNPKPGSLPNLLIQDPIGRTHTVDPAKYRFALQKKAERLKPKSEEKGSFYAFLQELEALGLVNLDLKIGSNFGKLDGNIVQIDVGNFTYCPEMAEENRLALQKKFEESLNK